MKLWKVTVNSWGWDSAKTMYFDSRKAAEKAASKYPASDSVQYAGNFTERKAAFLQGKIDTARKPKNQVEAEAYNVPLRYPDEK